MSAATDARERLEAAIHRAAVSSRTKRTAHVLAALSFADNYAEAVADERITGHVTSRTQGRERLAEATTEKFGGVPCGS